MSHLLRGVLLVMLLGYVLGLAAVLTQYNPVVATDVVVEGEQWLDAHGAPALMTGPGRVEFALNTLMFAPVALLSALAFARHPWANWVVYAFAGSCAVELFQGVYLLPRSAQFVDVVANTLGAVLGAGSARLLVLLMGRRRGSFSPRTGRVRPG